MRNTKRLETPEPLTMEEVKQAVRDLLTPGKQRPTLAGWEHDSRRELLIALHGEDGLPLKERIQRHIARMERLSIKDE